MEEDMAIDADFQKINLLHSIKELDRDSKSAQNIIDDMIYICHETAKMKGWWNPPKSFGEQIVMMHAELSEAIEEYRAQHATNEVYFVKDEQGFDKPEGVPIESADLLIRLLDTCGAEGIDIFNGFILKTRYNLTRSQRHGNKKI